MTLPGLLGVEHFSTTVPDLDAAVAFFVDVFGATVRNEVSFSEETGTTQMAEKFNTHPSASARLATLELSGVVLELFHYDAPDINHRTPRNCDAGGHHIGLRVANVEVAARYLEDLPGVRVLGPPTREPPRDGYCRGWVYFLTPWGTQMELADAEPEIAQLEASTP